MEVLAVQPAVAIAERDFMNRLLSLMQILGLLIAMVASGWAAEPSTDQTKAIAAITKLSGKITVDEKSAAKPMIGVSLEGTAATDAKLTPHVQATRAGRLLNLDYQLLDASGQIRTDQLLQQWPRNTPPKFTIWQDGREIDSGTFEYG